MVGRFATIHRGPPAFSSRAHILQNGDKHRQNSSEHLANDLSSIYSYFPQNVRPQPQRRATLNKIQIPLPSIQIFADDDTTTAVS